MVSRFIPLAAFLAAFCAFTFSSPAYSQTNDRPNIFGCGITWGSWLGLSGTAEAEWDAASMDRVVEMGGTNVGLSLAWIDIEPVQGQTYDFARMDRQVDQAMARGLEMFCYMGLTPDWALPPEAPQNQPGIGYRYPPDTQYIEEFEDYCRAVADRYKGKIKYYSFWNEPNGCSWINDGCGNGHMAHTYVPWLQRWYTAMKSQDPDCVLAVGGLDYGTYVPTGYTYIEDIYANGGGDYFDAVGIHPYGDVYGSDIIHWQALEDTYNTLVNHGDGHKKIWVNEWGWNTSDENQKAQNVATVLNALKQPQYHYVFQSNYLIISDLPGTPDNGHDYGLMSRNTSALELYPRQSWYAFRDVDKTFPDQPTFTPTPSPTPGDSPTPTPTGSATPSPTPDPSGNILLNSDFEEGFIVPPQDSGWQWAEHWSFLGASWWQNGGNFGIYQSPSNSQAVGTDGGTLDNTIYQTVQVNPGQDFTLSAWTRIDSNDTDEDNLRRRIAIDPTGGTDPEGPNVIHGPWDTSEETWEQMFLSATSQDFLLTVFIQVETTQVTGWHWLYVDDVTLIPDQPTPTPTPIAPPGLGNPSFEDALSGLWQMWAGPGSNQDALEREWNQFGQADGNWAVAVKGIGGGGKGAFQYVSNGWVPGHRYRLSASCMNFQNTALSYSIGYAYGDVGSSGGPTASYGTPVVSPSGWTQTQVELDYTGSQGVTLFLRADNEGHSERAGFDHVQITDLGTAASPTPTPSMTATPVPTESATPGPTSTVSPVPTTTVTPMPTSAHWAAW